MILDHDQEEILRRHLKALLGKRAYPKTICPSEVARALDQEELDKLDCYDWRDCMENIRALCWEMREYGVVEVLQKGEVVKVKSINDIVGPIRVRYHPDHRRQEMM
jgi:hypothetical protein